VKLAAAAAPSAGQPDVQLIKVIGSGFPSGPIPAQNVSVSLDPAVPNSGPSGTTTATAVMLFFGTTRTVSFQIPAALATQSPVAYNVSISGTTSGGVSFSSSNASSLTINPAAGLRLRPAISQQGQTLNVQIMGFYTNFLQGSTQANFGPGISVGGAPAGQYGPLTVTSATLASASLVISPFAGAGAVAATVATGVQTANATFTVQDKSFYIHSYSGKCLDYGIAPNGSSATVFLNDCALAHPVGVIEVDDQHDVILYAGSQVIGIHNPPVVTQGGPPPPPQTEFALELQAYNPILATTGNQIFALDGDSIILAHSRPCINTDSPPLCPPPPPQLVVQVQNARGASGSPLVAGARNLADSEFWDFKALDGSDRDPTNGFVPVATAAQLWNAVCASVVQPTRMRQVMATEADGPPLIDDPGQPDDGLPAPCDTFNAGRGSVIVISSPNACSSVGGAEPGDVQDIGACINLSDYAPLVLPAGVTLRGNRRGTNFGPQLFAARYTERAPCGWCMIEIHGDYVRITGLRLRGQSRSEDAANYTTHGIEVDYPQPSVNDASVTEFIAMIDHNDLSDWEEATVTVNGGHHNLGDYFNCVGVANDQRTQDNVRIERNFLHHNERDGAGYGAHTSGGRAVIVGNTFLMNRHAIASGGEGHSQYRAWYNLVLSPVPQYTVLGFGSPQQDFDMHGSSKDDPGYGGIGGNEVDIAGNTFLGGDRWNFELRGSPCVSVDYFRDNVTKRNRDSDFFGNGGTINLHNVGGPISTIQQGSEVPSTPVTVPPYNPPTSYGNPVVLAANNQYSDSSPGFSDPTVHLGVGDFDGDGDDDLFLATGTAWYYSPAGAREWRFLNAKTHTIDQLLFGDFDGDGRTDVVTLRGGQFLVSWGGVSDWEVLNPDPTGGRLLLLPSAITAMAVGDFDGDGHADIFWADGATWWISYGGNTPFVQVIVASNLLVKDLRFGDFDGNGTTDVFGVVNGNWMVRYGPKFFQGDLGGWQLLRPALTNTVDGLIVGDFTGSGRVGVAMSCFSFTSPGCWQVSAGGIQDWHPYTIGSWATDLAAVGHFLGRVDASQRLVPVDLLFWNDASPLANFIAMCDPSVEVGTGLCLSVGGIVPSYRYTSQDMR
jgi:VCBS repeat protein